MNIAELFIKRPVMTTLVMLGILFFGVFAFRYLPVSDLPNVDFPVIMVRGTLPGASPETMAASVATPLEKEFSTISGVQSMSSTSYQGVSEIILMFDIRRDIDAAAQDVQAAISRASALLPSDMPSLPSYQKVNPADQPIVYIALTSPTLPLSTLNEYGENMMAKRISMVTGVAQVQVYGAQKYAVRVQLNPKELSSRGIGIDEVAAAIQRGNVNLPTGVLYGNERAFTIKAKGELTRAKDYEPLVVAYRAGKAVRLGELGNVFDSVQDNKSAAWYGDSTGRQKSIVLAIQKQPGTNTIEVANAVKELLPTFKQQLPASVSMHLLYDRSDSIHESVNDVEFTLILTLGLVVMVIFLFLRNFYATIIPSLTLPMAVVGTFAIMYLYGFSVNNLTLMALTLSVGFVVDDAIVMLENIVRHNEMGKPVFQAALEGSREVGFTIVSMTLSLAAVFIPILFMGGIVGNLFREFSVTIGMAVLVSGFVSLTLTPMLSSRFLKPVHKAEHGRFYNTLENILTVSLQTYERWLRIVLNHKRSAMIVSGLILISMGLLFKFISKGFLPSEDRNFMIAFTEATQGISYKSMQTHQEQLNAILQEEPAIEAYLSITGAFGASNSGIIFVKMKSRAERDKSVDELVEDYRAKLAKVPGIISFVQNPPPIQTSGEHSKALYQFVLQAPDTSELYRNAALFEEKMRGLPALQDVTSDMQIVNPQVNIDILRDKASSLNVTAEQVENALYYAYGSRKVSTILAANDQYDVIMELLPEYQMDPESLKLLYVRSSTNQLVPLNAVSGIDTGVGPLTVHHAGQLPAVTIAFNLKPGYSIGEAVQSVKDLAASTLPATMSTNFRGDAEAFASSQAGMGVLLMMSVLVIYLVLGILYESFIHPLTILSALPFAGFGALLTLLIFRTELSLYAFVGIIMLVGLVKKNGIMMIDFAIEAQRSEGKSPKEAIIEACVIRFRPIMMTTMAALMGALPLALGLGAGAESRRPLGLAVVGGLIFSQTLTLFVTPVFYLYMESLQNWTRRKVSRMPVKSSDAGEKLAVESARN